jgi:Membrane bound beta barrel domain (DUF5777)
MTTNSAKRGFLIKSARIFTTTAFIFLGFAAISHGQTTGTSAVKPESPTEDKSSMKVAFDETETGIIIVESNGEKIRIDTTKKTVTQLTAAESKPVESETPKESTVAEAEPQEEEGLYDFDSGNEPFDYRLVNVPTPKKVPKGTWNMSFTHRFSQPIHPFSESGRGLLGFDSFSVSSFGISYGITDKLYFNAYRSPICQKGICRTIELGFGYHVTDQNKKSPVALSVYGSVEGNDNFTEEYTYNLQTMISRHFGKRVYAFFSPAIHLNANGQHRFNPRPDDYFPPAEVANTFKLPTNGASFGMGTAVMITPTLLGIFEFTPRTGFKLGRVDPVFDADFNVVNFENISYPEIGFGIQKNIGLHSFTITFSNTQTTTTSRYNSSNILLKPRNFVIGFNLFRRW